MATGPRYYTPSTKWDSSNPLLMMIIVQAMFFVSLNFIKSIYTFSRMDPEAFYRNIYYWSILSADPDKFLTRPWTFITMQFSEVKLIVVIGNLIWTWMFGYLIQDLVGGEKIFPIYIYSSLFAGCLFILSVNVFQREAVPNAFFTGIIPGILGLASAATTISPKYRIFPMVGGGIPLWVISLVYVLLNFSTAQGYFAMIPQLTGLLVGFGFVKLLQQGTDPGSWMIAFSNQIIHFFSPGKRKQKTSKQQSFYDSSGRKPFVKKPNLTQKRVDELLDKINQFGYDHLTDEEKAFLQQASKKDL
ncbi:MAG: rhomboid family intramembrane serine protease [Bacteroidota bacterium]|jgi:membrane associated rhomboid family serine protease|nr:rhomboid family intramembrane serine protease [Chitinophagaceae bacterium]MCE2758498.1 rhomboid family intramembrane serine protease [Chitinophagaceae bacterium]